MIIPHHLLVSGDDHDREVVDPVKLFGFCLRRSSHAGELVVHAEVVLEGDCRHRDVLAPDPHTFFGLDGLVESLAVAATAHHSTGEFIDDDDFAVVDDVVLVAFVDRVGGQGLLEIVGEFCVAVVVDAFAFGNAGEPLDLVNAIFSQRCGTMLGVHLIVTSRSKLGNKLGKLVVAVGGGAGLGGDDQRSSRLVDEDVVHLVDYSEAQFALHHLARFDSHVVAEIVEPELVVGAVSDVGLVRLPPRHRA